MDKITELHYARMIMFRPVAAAKHLPYKTAEEIENSMAALWTLRREIDFKQSLIDNAIAHLQLARAGKAK